MRELSSYVFSPLREGDIALYRGCGNGLAPILLAAAEEGSLGCVERLEHEHALKAELDAHWAARPVALARHNGGMALVLEDPGGTPVDRLLDGPLEISHFLRIAIPLAEVLRQVHARGLIHKDIKPTNILMDSASGSVWLTGFGIASRLPREHQAPAPPEVIAGTLAYMAPEQTGRMNRSVDSRSDLYALGVTLYEMLTGHLPFTAADPMEWVHCHIARQPLPPNERLAGVPAALSAIVMKLLAKTAEERYQTASGLEVDLRRCLGEWEKHRRIDPFPLGTHDPPDRLLIPEKLYGREREIDALLAAFDRVVAHGTPELVLVSGYSGVGKSSVVNELHKALVSPRGLFASGKFDQYKRDIPYATLAQAFQTLVRQILAKSEAEVGHWRGALEDAVGPNGQLIVNLIPEVEFVIGKQPPVPDLPPQDAQNRFQTVLRRFLGVFARPEHPLALFLDDLQWLDAATLELLEQLITDPDVRHVLLVGAYRNNEVSPSHPLMRTLEAIRKAGARMQEIVLAPLELDDVGRLVVDSLRCNRDSAHPLAQLVHEKTGGNPFFAIQFLTGLAEEGLLAFDTDAATWISDLARIRAKGYTDNVVDFMVAKLKRLSDTTQQALKQLACLGNVAEIAALTLVRGVSEEEIHTALWEAASTGLVLRLDRSYAFLHDRVQEAAYALIPEDERAAAHLQIGRVLASQAPSEELEEKIFEIVNQLDRGAMLIHSREERDRVAELNLIAGKRAKTSTAYASALTYLAAGRALLTEDSWEQQYELTFSIEYHQAECELLTADLAAAEERLIMLSHRAGNLIDIAAVACLQLTLYTTLDRSDRGVEVCLAYLQRGGVHWLPHPTADEVRHEYARIWQQVGSRSIEELVDLPLMTNAEVRATLDVLTEVVTPALFTDENLLSLVICRMVNLSLEHGNSDGSCFAYVWLGMVLGPHFGDYRAGYRFGSLGYDLVEKRGLHRYQARAYMSFGNLVMPWTRHVQTGRDLVRRAFDTANKIGDLTFAAYSCNNLNTNLIASGEPLGDAQREAENGLDFARKARFGLVIDIITAQLGLIRTLRGLTAEFGSFNDEQFNESPFEDHLRSDPRLALPECWYWVRKLQARVYANDYASAIEAASKAQQLLWTSPSFFEVAEFHFYDAVARAAQCDAASASERARHLEMLAAHHKQLEVWAENCPENFANRAALIGAEIARLEGRDADAMRLFEEAIRSAAENGFVQNEGLAHEVAARFYAARGAETIAHACLREARRCYLRWGAFGKTRQLEQLHPHLRDAAIAASPTTTIGAPVEQLDVGTVLKAAQAVSGEIVLGKLIETLLRIAVEHAGAERGLLILFPGDEARIVAEATTGRGQVEVTLRQTAPSPAELPESVLHTVIRTRESVILEDASAQNPFSADEYLRQKHARSVLCLPLVKQSKLIGVLYLENNLASHVFTPARISVLELLASQAAISLENARLYSDLREREARIRRLVDSNIIGVMIWDFQGRIVEANQTILDMFGYSREELLSGRIKWAELTPAEWTRADQDALAQVSATGSCRPYEKEYFRKDGSRVAVLIAGALFEWKRDEGVAFVIDMTDRKRAEEKLRSSEQRLLDAQMELAHLTRVTALGELTASIAHEVNQPLAGVVANAESGLRWLRRETPDLDAACRSLEWIIDDGHRASEVIRRVRSLAHKASVEKLPLDVNDVAREVIALVQRELTSHRVSLRTELAPALPMILGDRVQLQQVIINLVMNGNEAMQAVMDRPRELVIRSRQDGAQQVLLSVTDCGVGISVENADRLFNPFFTTKSSGMGMGLSICRSIVETHGGRLWATANVPHGATLQFTLPVNAGTAS
ncbi:trifunctional serine/threonine-protein kinase/ATP-binding protein/sensor histidine kinase [Bradyrhizobium erythrophlei]|uniref:histidine kinase n=1 Tax=Bradyrhizobium erythrophlei TaxID=1437360 RepID=A0A1M5QD05_9BRAD|nr:trifunctional serine/threonine-protein kinase/ATP-binding protein/sensor histidine kinase [Bradyrhizobium erythrophlei]SHH12025.1 serine/threonine protein kinase and signal transduction histidine kinase with GAF sensor [Bradyrhizobium erythrophlei]